MKRCIFALVLLPLLIQACGFHLPGATELPAQMSTTRLEVQDPYSAFARKLRSLLVQNGIQVIDEGEGTAILEVPQNRVRKEILTIGDNARVREYRVSHVVRFRLVDAQGNIISQEHELEQSRVISFDEQDILAAAQEEEFLRQNMADSLSRLVIRHLSEPGNQVP